MGAPPPVQPPMVGLGGCTGGAPPPILDEVWLDVEEICKHVNAKSLKFLSIDGLYRAMGFEKRNDDYPQLTDHYFTGDYPIKIIDELGDEKITQLSLLSSGSNN